MSAEPTEDTASLIDPIPFRDVCKEVTFAPGDLLRTKGQLSIDMLLLTAGEVEVALDPKAPAGTSLVARAGSPIGEIGFLTGVPATATVRARTAVKALYIDDGAWREIEARLPHLAVTLYRQLAAVAEGRQSHNLVFLAEKGVEPPESRSEVVFCRTRELLQDAQRIRYEIYCGELGRSSPHADHGKRVIADDLDSRGHVLLTFENGSPIATMRLNMSRDGGLGVLEQLYGMEQSPFHPEATAICTKFIVKKAHRVGQSSFRLMATAVELAQRYGIKHCYIDCIPGLKPFYTSLGFKQAGPAFLHRENGCSYPLMLDVDRFAKRISRLTGFVLG